MTDAFISYRRRPSAALAQLIQEKLKNRHGLDAYVDTTRTDSNRVTFPERLMGAIDSARCFICLLGEGTLDSEWVMKEVERAHQLKKFCIPVFQESYTPPTIPSPAVDYLLSYDGVHIFDLKNVLVNESVAQIAALVPPRPRPARWMLVFALALVLMAGMLAVLNSQGQPPAPTPTLSVTPAVLAAVTTTVPTSTDPPMGTPTKTLTPTDSPTHTPTATTRLSDTPRPPANERPTQVLTATRTPTDQPIQTPDVTATRTNIPALHLTEIYASSVTPARGSNPSARRPSLPRQPFEDYFTTSGGLRVGIPSGFTPMEFSPEVVVFNNAVTEEYIAVWTGDAYREFVGTPSNPATVAEALALFNEDGVLLESPRSIGIGDSYGVELKVLIDGEIEAGWIFLDTPDGLMTGLFYDEDDPLSEDFTRSGYGVLGSAAHE